MATTFDHRAYLARFDIPLGAPPSPGYPLQPPSCPPSPVVDEIDLTKDEDDVISVDMEMLKRDYRGWFSDCGIPEKFYRYISTGLVKLEEYEISADLFTETALECLTEFTLDRPHVLQVPHEFPLNLWIRQQMGFDLAFEYWSNLYMEKFQLQQLPSILVLLEKYIHFRAYCHYQWEQRKWDACLDMGSGNTSTRANVISICFAKYYNEGNK